MAYRMALSLEPCHKFCGCHTCPSSVYFPSPGGDSPATKRMIYERRSLFHHPRAGYQQIGDFVYPAWINNTMRIVEEPASDSVSQPLTLRQRAFQLIAMQARDQVISKFKISSFSPRLLRWHVPQARQMADWLLNSAVFSDLPGDMPSRVFDFLPKIVTPVPDQPFYLFELLGYPFHADLSAQNQVLYDYFYKDPSFFELPLNRAEFERKIDDLHEYMDTLYVQVY